MPNHIMHEVSKAYDDLAEGYDDYHVDGKSQAENRLIADYLQSYIKSDDLIVDLGCGTGLLLDLVSLPPERYIGVDISPGMLKYARAKHPGYRFELGDIEKPIEALGATKVDLAVSLFGSASYCDLEAVKHSVPEMVRPGGRFFLMLCGPRYLARKTYINKSESVVRPHSEAALARAFPGAKIWGMSYLVDKVPHTLPASVLDRLLKLDLRTAGRWRKDACFFLNVEGTR